MTPPPTRFRDDPTSILVIALVGALTCQALAPWAWFMAHAHIKQCALDGQSPDGFVLAARALAVFGTVVLVLAIGAIALTWLGIAIAEVLERAGAIG